MKITSDRSIYPAAVMFACFVGSNVTYANSLSSFVQIAVGTDTTAQYVTRSGTDNQTRQLADSQAGTIDSYPIPDNAWTSSGFALARADYGVLKVSTSSTSTNSGFASTQAFASFSDELTFNSAGLQNQRGVLTASLLVSASSGVTSSGSFLGAPTGGSAQTTWDMVVMADGTGVLDVRKGAAEPAASFGCCNFERVNGVPGTATGLFTVQIPFTFGTPLALTFAADAYSLTERGDGSAFSNLGNSIYWGGIQAVSFDGEVVPYSLSAASGTNWTSSMAPVPEPSTYGMLLAGIGMLAFVVRRRLGGTMSA